MITLVISGEEIRRDEVVVAGRGYRHLFRARRLRGEEPVRFVDGAGFARVGRALEVGSEKASFVLGEQAPANEPARHVELLAPAPKASRLAWMVEKATEVGVSAIRLIHTERAPRKLGRAALDRLGRVAIAAVEQSQRSVVPEITGVHPFDEIESLLEPLSERWLLEPTAPPDPAGSGDSRAALLVGPEGGWTSTEIERLMAWNCRPVGLGSTTLRIETAATIGCAMLLVPGRRS
jgi:16S rRNA (uracil1498-N3)-methyltransferase